MIVNRTLTKKVLEKLVHETFSNFGTLSSSSLLDSLKLLGFYYATNAGISINIEDLKTPDIKKQVLEKANQETERVSLEWQQGFISDTERFQSIIDSWNLATESLKNRIIEYYQNFDPVNNLYIMAFSGARGNMSQVRQLVGMRGLMSDQDGKIIDLPIQKNFREGLSSIDYIISSYGARKGIVDTALKTADSGYLTRRLIYVAQDLVIREVDCHTQEGLFVLFSSKTSTDNFIGRSLLSAKKMNFPYQEVSQISNKNLLLTPQILLKLKEQGPLLLNLRSSLTCQSHGSICMQCYGWDLSQEKLITLGQVVGILAAQSIGEPGTQLTMRTFHTGGIFTSESLKQILAPFSGKLILPENFHFQTFSYRTNHGIRVFKLQQETVLTMKNWKGVTQEISIPRGASLYVEESTFLAQGQLIAEYSTESAVSGIRRFKPIYTPLGGEIKLQKISLRKGQDSSRMFVPGSVKRRITRDQGTVWIASGKIFSLPEEAYFLFPKALEKEKALAKLKIVTNKGGLILQDKNSLSIVYESREKSTTISSNSKRTFQEKNTTNSPQIYQKRDVLKLFNFIKKLKNCSMKIVCLTKNFQYVDPYTTVGFVYIYPECQEKIYNVRAKTNPTLVPVEQKTKTEKAKLKVLLEELTFLSGQEEPSSEILKFLQKKSMQKEKSSEEFLRLQPLFGKIFSPIFILTESDVWKIASDQVNNFDFLENKKLFVRSGTKINSTLTFNRSGLFLKNDGLKLTFQHATPIFIGENSILNYISGDFVEKKKVLAISVNYTQQTDDIVQGLPKIEELIEARKGKNKCCLVRKPGTIISDENGLYNLKDYNSFVNLYSHYTMKSDEKIDLGVNFALWKQKQLMIEDAEEKKKSWLKRKTQIYVVSGFRLLPDERHLNYYTKKEQENYILFLDQFYIELDIYAQLQKKKDVMELIKISKKLQDPEEIFNQPLAKALMSTWLLYQLQDSFDRKNGKLYVTKQEDFTLYKYDLKTGKRIKWRDSLSYDIKELVLHHVFIDEETGKYLVLDTSYHSHYLEPISSFEEYRLPLNSRCLVTQNQFVDIGEPLTEGTIDIHELLEIFFEYHLLTDRNRMKATLRSLHKFQLLLVNSIQAIYHSQGVTIASKHIEIIVRQMTSKVMIKEGGVSSTLLPGELLNLSSIKEIIKNYENMPVSWKKRKKESFLSAGLGEKSLYPLFEPKVKSATTLSLIKDGFLSAAGFQETRKVLTKAAIEGKSDWLRGLKESIISGRLIPAGSSFLNYKNYLDNLYSFKIKNQKS